MYVINIRYIVQFIDIDNDEHLVFSLIVALNRYKTNQIHMHSTISHLQTWQ